MELLVGDKKAATIIAMKGYPFTRKTEFAQNIAASLECPILSSEDVLWCPKPPMSPEREYEAFSIVCKMALRHICMGISKNVVIDSPLSSRRYLNLIKILFSGIFRMKVRVIIVECKPTNSYSWKMKFEEHLASNPPGQYWFKAKSWEDVEKAIQDHPDYDVDISVKGVFFSKLVVDPLVDCRIQNPSLSNILLGGPQANKNTDLVEAVKYMMTRDKRDGPNVIIYHQWLQQSRYRSSSTSSSSSITPHDKKHCSKHGHDIVPNSRVVEHEATDCMACQKKVSRSGHDVDAHCYCMNCDLALHMECAEAFIDDHEARKQIYRSTLRGNSFTKESVCNPCRESGNKGLRDCMTCLFESHLRSRVYPTVIKHFDLEEHFLTISFKRNEPVFGKSYPCVACGEINSTCPYFCKDHGIAYCYECVTLPRRVKDEHGGYHHNLSLKFESEEAEDYVCQECSEFRDPTLWFYSCENCTGYDLHPYCVRKIQQFHPTFQNRQPKHLNSR